MERVIFSADIHGNMDQYRAILEHAKKENADIVVFGGDLTPKDAKRRTPEGQRNFIENELFPLLEEFKNGSDIHVLFIMGNDDFRSNRDLLVDGQDYYGYRMIDEVPYISKSGYTFVGYTYVPFTPFKYKCWEKRDRKTDIDFSHRDDTRQSGVISKGDDLVPHDLKTVFDQTSIQDDIEELTDGLDMDKLVLISHAPPYGTNCDFNRQNKHVGSKGLRDFIISAQPFATLHGHIHETVDLKGNHIEHIGKTFSVAVGNDHKPKRPYIIDAVLGKNPTFRRLQIGK